MEAGTDYAESDLESGCNSEVDCILGAGHATGRRKPDFVDRIQGSKMLSYTGCGAGYHNSDPASGAVGCHNSLS